MNKLTRQQMLDIINGGGAIIFRNRTLRKVEDVPTQEEIDEYYEDSSSPGNGLSLSDFASAQFEESETGKIQIKESILGASLPVGDLHAATNFLEKIQNRTLLLEEAPESYIETFDSSSTIVPYTSNSFNADTQISGGKITAVGNNSGSSNAYISRLETTPRNYTNNYVEFELDFSNPSTSASNYFFGGFQSHESGSNIFNLLFLAGIKIAKNNPLQIQCFNSSTSFFYTHNASVIPTRVRIKDNGGVFYYYAMFDGLWTELATYDHSNNMTAVRISYFISTHQEAEGIGLKEIRSDKTENDTLLDKALIWWNVANSRFENVNLSDLRTAFELPIIPAGDLNSTTNFLEKIQNRVIELTPTPGLSEIYDNFDDNFLDLSFWNSIPIGGVTITEDTGRINFNFPESQSFVSPYIETVGFYGFNNGSAQLRMISPSNGQTNNSHGGLYIIKDSDNYIYMTRHSYYGATYCIVVTNGVASSGTIGSTHNYHRITHNADTDTIDFFGSADGVTWTNILADVPISWSLEIVKFQIKVNASVGYAQGFTFDDFSASVILFDEMENNSLIIWSASENKFVDISLIDLVSVINEMGIFGLSSRRTETFEESGVASGVSISKYVQLGTSFQLMNVTSNVPVRVRIYSTPAYREADSARSLGVDPTGEHGLIAELVTTEENLSIDLAPFATGSSLDDPPSSWIAASIQNRSGETEDLAVTFLVLPLEAYDSEEDYPEVIEPM